MWRVLDAHQTWHLGQCEGLPTLVPVQRSWYFLNVHKGLGINCLALNIRFWKLRLKSSFWEFIHATFIESSTLKYCDSAGEANGALGTPVLGKLTTQLQQIESKVILIPHEKSMPEGFARTRRVRESVQDTTVGLKGFGVQAPSASLHRCGHRWESRA